MVDKLSPRLFVWLFVFVLVCSRERGSTTIPQVFYARVKYARVRFFTKALR